MGFSSWLFNVTEGIGIAFDAIRANKVRAALTILGVAVGVFVVVTLSAAVHGINASVAKDLESAGPSSFYMYRRPVSLTTICDGTDDTCAWRRNPSITMDEASRILHSEIAAVTAHVGAGAKFTYKERKSEVVDRGYSAGGSLLTVRHHRWPRLHVRGDVTGANIVVVNAEMAKRLFGESDRSTKPSTSTASRSRSRCALQQGQLPRQADFVNLGH